MSDEDLTAPYMRALNYEIEETMNIVMESREYLQHRQIENARYYQPALSLLDSLRTTREKFNAKVEEALEHIESESRQIERLKETNLESLSELEVSANALEDQPLIGDDHPIRLAIRSISSLFPFIVFSLVTFCSR